jgi:hypothetical protein
MDTWKYEIYFSCLTRISHSFDFQDFRVLRNEPCMKNNERLACIHIFFFLPDINECTKGTHKCKPRAEQCNNLEGTYSCRCNPGYIRTHSDGHCEGTINLYM